MHSRITAENAKDMVNLYDAEYIKICGQIKNAAEEGKHYIKVKHMDNLKVKHRLEKDGFDVDIHVTDDCYLHRIWWGY